MNVKFLNPFIDAVYEVLEAETSLQVQRGSLSLETDPYLTQDVTVVIGMVGQVEGSVFYGMSYTMALNLVSRMMGETYESFDTLAQSGIAELGNVITGRASIKLADSGFEATLSPPTLIEGADATISTLDNPRLVVPLMSEAGDMVIHLALRERTNFSLSTPQIETPPAPSLL